MGRKTWFRLRQCAYGFTACSVVALWYYVLTTLSDTCHGPEVQRQLCDVYARGQVAGKLCHELCVKKSVSLGSCDSPLDSDQLIFSAVLPSKKSSPTNPLDRITIKIPSSHRYSPSLNLSRSVYSKPVKGSATSAFNEMLLDYLVAKLGGDNKKATSTTGNLASLRDRLLDAADVDKDGKVSLSEAKTIWALLRDHEFFVTFLFQDSDQIPRLRGFCGAAFAVDAVPVKRLYHRRRDSDAASKGDEEEKKTDSSSYSSSSSSSIFSPLDLFFSQRHLWGLPSWPDRAKVGVGVLEFISHIHAHDFAGSFFLCGTDESNIGYSSKHDARFYDLSSVLSKEMLSKELTKRSCEAGPRDCQLSTHCTTMCDESARKCTAELLRPNLHLGCRILKEYLLFGVPDDLEAELKKLFARCDVLENKNDQVDVTPTLLLNEIKSLLWKRISNSASV